jgi:single-strand DNA-binding protein
MAPLFQAFARWAKKAPFRPEHVRISLDRTEYRTLWCFAACLLNDFPARKLARHLRCTEMPFDEAEEDMATINKVILVGNLGTDPELRYTKNNKPVCNFPVATNERWVDEEGAKKERVCWHRIEAWGKQAELCASYLKRGRQVYIEGKLKKDEYVDREGIKRYAFTIVARSVLFLGGGGGPNRVDAPLVHSAPEVPEPPPPSPWQATDDELPF